MAQVAQLTAKVIAPFALPGDSCLCLFNEPCGVAPAMIQAEKKQRRQVAGNISDRRTLNGGSRASIKLAI
jgi:hypothetical protein